MLGKSHVSQSRSKSFCRYAGVYLALQEDAGVEACGASFPVALAVKSSSKPPKKTPTALGGKATYYCPLVSDKKHLRESQTIRTNRERPNFRHPLLPVFVTCCSQIWKAQGTQRFSCCTGPEDASSQLIFLGSVEDD